MEDIHISINNQYGFIRYDSLPGIPSVYNIPTTIRDASVVDGIVGYAARQCMTCSHCATATASPYLFFVSQFKGIKLDSFYDDIGYRPLTLPPTAEQEEESTLPAVPQEEGGPIEAQPITLQPLGSSSVGTDTKDITSSRTRTETANTETWGSPFNKYNTLLYQGTIQGNSLVTVRLGSDSTSSGDQDDREFNISGRPGSPSIVDNSSSSASMSTDVTDTVMSGEDEPNVETIVDSTRNQCNTLQEPVEAVSSQRETPNVRIEPDTFRALMDNRKDEELRPSDADSSMGNESASSSNHQFMTLDTASPELDESRTEETVKLEPHTGEFIDPIDY